MAFKPIDVVLENNKILRKENKEVVFPLSKEDRDMIDKMIKHLTYSQIEQKSVKYNLRPGMGMAAPQVGINKRYFVIVHEFDDGLFDEYVMINPKIISHSEELIYAGGGEGCLSVEREVEGIVPRYARVTIEGYNESGTKVKFRGREELAIAFQHEMDHLDGILFTDKIDKKNPYKNQEKMRMI